MKKLNNTEINALAGKILSDSCTTNQKEREALEAKVIVAMNKAWSKFKKSADYKVLVKYGVEGNFKKNKVIPDVKEGGFVFSANYTNNYNRVISADFGSIYVKGDIDRPSYEQIRRELVLGQIDAKDLDSLVSKVKKSLGLK